MFSKCNSTGNKELKLILKISGGENKDHASLVSVVSSSVTSESDRYYTSSDIFFFRD